MTGAVAVIPDQSITSRMVALTSGTTYNSTDETTTSTTYANTTTTVSVTITSGVAQQHFILNRAYMYNSGANTCYNAPAIGGSAASDSDAGIIDAQSNGNGSMGTQESIGAAQASPSTHTHKLRTSGGTVHWNFRRISAKAA